MTVRDYSVEAIVVRHDALFDDFWKGSVILKVLARDFNAELFLRHSRAFIYSVRDDVAVELVRSVRDLVLRIAHQHVGVHDLYLFAVVVRSFRNERESIRRRGRHGAVIGRGAVRIYRRGTISTRGNGH